MTVHKINSFIDKVLRPMAVAVGSAVILSVGTFIIVTLPAFRTNLTVLTKSMEEVKTCVKEARQDAKEYQEGINKTLLETLVKQGQLETRINDLDRQLNYQNNNKNLKP